MVGYLARTALQLVTFFLTLGTTVYSAYRGHAEVDSRVPHAWAFHGSRRDASAASLCRGSRVLVLACVLVGHFVRAALDGSV